MVPWKYIGDIDFALHWCVKKWDIHDTCSCQKLDYLAIAKRNVNKDLWLWYHSNIQFRSVHLQIEIPEVDRGSNSA